jgi:hypothetical protein
VGAFIASGFAVAILSAIFLRRRLHESGPSQNMTTAGRRNGRLALPLIFFLAFAAVLGVLLLLRGQPPF